MLQTIQLAKHLGSRTLFSELSWQLQPGDRIGLVGANGAGKTTLLRIINGHEAHDGGSVTWGRDETVGYLPQEAPRHDGGTVLARVLSAATEVQELGEKIAAVEKAMASAAAAEAMALAGQHAELLQRYQLLDGYTLEPRAREILAGLGFGAERLEAPLRALSGGWWMRVELARQLLLRPTYLFLDEPTNHLDLDSLQWLETFLAGYTGAWVVVSHDRYFLNRMVDGIAELSEDGLFTFPGSYDDYIQAKTELDERLAAEARSRAKRVAAIESFIERFRAKATKARQAQSRVKQLAREAPAPQAKKKARTVRFALPEPARSGDVVLTCRGLAKRFGAQVIYEGFDLEVRRGDKIALLGPNGAGKSTLLKMCAGLLAPDHGNLSLGHNVEAFYFAQHQLDTLNPAHTVYEELQATMPLEPIARVRGILGAFLFSGDSVDKRVAVLSGGEKSRLALAKMLARPANFLLLDEPTNHLDLASRDMLEAALGAFAGTVLFISHDRYFINSLATQVLEIRPGREPRHFPGDYDYHLWKLQQEAAAPAEATRPAGNAGAKPRSEAAAERAERKQAEREAGKRQKQAAELEAQIAGHEARVAAIDASLCDPEVYSDGPQSKRLLDERSDVEEALRELYVTWEGLAS